MPALAIVPATEPSPADQLAALKIERADLRKEAARLTGIRSRLNEAENGEREALAAIGELGKAEIAAMTRWASEGAVGDPPAVDHEERAALAKQLAAAQAASAAAKGAAVDLDKQRGTIEQRQRDLASEIQSLAFTVIGDEHAAALADLAALATQASRLVAKIRAQGLWFGFEGRRFQSIGQHDTAMEFFRRAEALRKATLPEVLPTIGEVDLAQRDWAERFHSLLQG